MYTTSDSSASYEYYTLSERILINENSTNEEFCLSFYYYFTNDMRRPRITVRLGAINDSSIYQYPVTVTPQRENKWHYSETTFRASSNEYQVRQ